MAHSLVAVLVCLFAGVGSLADEPKRDHEIVPGDYFTLADIMAASVSPDGRHVAYLEQRWEPPREKRNVDLWLLEIATREARRLTFDQANESSPQWSPDGKQIYFISNYKRAGEELPPHNGTRQVWRIRTDGGEPQAVTRLEDGIDDFDLSADGLAVYYTVRTEETEDAWKEMRESHKELDYGHGVTGFSQVWKLDLKNWRAQKLVDEKRVVTALKVSPDQSRVAMVTNPDEELIHKEGWSRIDVYDTASKKIVVVTPDGWRDDHFSPFGWLNEVAWSGDSQALAFSISFDGYPDRILVAEWDEGKPGLSELERPDGVNVAGGSLHWRGSTRDLCFVGADHARSRVYAIRDVTGKGQGKSVTLTPGDASVKEFSFSTAGDVHAVVNGTLTHPPDIFVVGKNGKLDRLTNVNPQVDRWKLPQISLVSWKGEDGREIQGILELPPDHKPEDGPLPLVVEIHGGPTSATNYEFRFWIYGRTILAARGYALLSPNYRGSTGYGDEFMIELVGHENDIEVQDILSGVDAMVQRGIADPERLGVMGWSNGGFLTNCLISSSERFKAASSGAGVVDQVLQWGIEDTPGHVINFMEGTLPWANPEEYRAGSPLFNLDKVRTPTLIHVGELDPRVPAAHARALYRGLRYYLKVPTELIVYPDEGHGLTTYAHRKAKLEWDLTWFDHHILGKPLEEISFGDE